MCCVVVYLSFKVFHIHSFRLEYSIKPRQQILVKMKRLTTANCFYYVNRTQWVNRENSQSTTERTTRETGNSTQPSTSQHLLGNSGFICRILAHKRRDQSACNFVFRETAYRTNISFMDRKRNSA